MTDHTQDPTSHDALSTPKPFTAPKLAQLGELASVTRGPGTAGTQDAVIFQSGGDPTNDPS